MQQSRGEALRTALRWKILLPVNQPAGVALADLPIDFGRQFRHVIVYE
jgi:hypothetical protein